MQSETWQCQNCKKDFVIEPDDFGFYERIKVPAPTWCPECRIVRRMAFRNERSLYKRKNNAPGRSEEMLSMYAPDSPYTVYDKEYWWSDKWDPTDYGIEYDPSRPFFEQYDKLWKKTPLPALQTINSVNSQYTNYVDGNKNCYLVFGCGYDENVRYSNRSNFSKDSQDMLTSPHNELCYDILDCQECFSVMGSESCTSCVNSSYLYGCRNCNNCFACSNLVSKSYCYFNEQLTKDDYENKLKSLKLSSYANREKIREKYESEIRGKAIRRYANIVKCENCTGHNITKSKNSHNCFDISDEAENCRFSAHSLFIKENYDVYGNYKTELCYEGVDTDVGMNDLAIITTYSSNNCAYCFSCQASSNLFGCIGLRGKEYCILNKQYTKEEYNKLKDEIVKQMAEKPYIDAKGRAYVYGDFFPMEISPWAYNETIAQEYFPLTQEEARERGYGWKEKESKNYEIEIKNEELPDDISDVKDDILNKSVECAHKGKCNEQCTEAFRIIPDELGFYRRLGLPLPRLCSNCRHYGRLAKRNPMKLWSRSCMCEKSNHGHRDKCPNEFETSYAPDKPETVYCESCYQKEVY